MKHRVIFFYNYNCIEKKVDDSKINEFIDKPNVAIDPDTSELEKRDVKRQYWKFEGGRVVEKSDEEKKFIDEYHEQNMQTNPHIIEIVREVIKEVPIEIEKEVIREVIKEIEIEKEKLVTQYKTPLWNYVLMGILLFITILIGVYKHG